MAIGILEGLINKGDGEPVGKNHLLGEPEKEVVGRTLRLLWSANLVTFELLKKILGAKDWASKERWPKR